MLHFEQELRWELVVLLGDDNRKLFANVIPMVLFEVYAMV